MALDDFEERFAAAVKAALDASRTVGEEYPGAPADRGCPSLDSISAYYEGTVSRNERARMEEHFAVCAKCQGTLAALLRAAPEEAGHEGRAQSAGIDPEPRDSFAAPSAASGRIWRIAGIATGVMALIAAAVLGGAYIYRTKGSSQPNSSELALDETNSKAVQTQTGPVAAAGASQTAPAAPPTARPEASLNSNGRSGVAAELPTPAAAGREAARGNAESASADQAAAALGALASTPTPPSAAASSAAPRTAAVAPEPGKIAVSRAATPVKKPAPQSASSGEKGATAAALAAAAAAGAVRATPAASQKGALTVQPTPSASASAVAASNLPAKQKPGAELADTRKRTTGSTSPETISKNTAGPEPGRSGVINSQSSNDARQSAANEERRARLMREAKAQAEKDAKLRAELAKARREARIRAELDSAKVVTRQKSAPVRTAFAPSIRSHAPEGKRAAALASAPVPVPASAQTPAKPAASAPVVAAIAPGIPVAPRAILVASPDHRVYWSLQNSGVIYRTNDRKSWTPQFSGTTADLLAGMAPSDTVCWAVGRRGTILLTSDGAHWEQVRSPTSADVTGVIAAGKDVATIHTADGLSYNTWDGGSNWQPLK